MSPCLGAVGEEILQQPCVKVDHVCRQQAFLAHRLFFQHRPGLGKAIDAQLLLIDNPEATIADLRELVKGPDFPTGAYICGYDGIQSAYTTGRGIIKLRAKAEIEEISKEGREEIIITELPYQVNKSRLVEQIAQLVRDKKVEGISDLRDESDRDGMRVVIELRKNEVGEIILNQLFKHTALQTTFGQVS